MHPITDAEISYAAAIARARHGRMPPWVAFDDVMQEALVGLTEAAHRWDPDRGVPFLPFAGIRISGAILDAARRDDHALRSERDAGKAPPRAVSFDALRGWGNPTADGRQDGGFPDGSDVAQHVTDVEAVRGAFRRLPAQEQVLIGWHYWSDRSLTDLADLWGVTVARISQIHHEALGHLRNALTDRRIAA